MGVGPDDIATLERLIAVCQTRGAGPVAGVSFSDGSLHVSFVAYAHTQPASEPESPEDAQRKRADRERADKEAFRATMFRAAARIRTPGEL